VSQQAQMFVVKKVLSVHNNARAHSAAATVEVIRQLKFEFLPESPYSPDPVPSDCHMFGLLKGALRGRRFASDDEVKDAMRMWLRSQSKISSQMGSKGFRTATHYASKKKKG
jgi:transposase